METRTVFGKVTDYGIGGNHNFQIEMQGATEWKRAGGYDNNLYFKKDDYNTALIAKEEPLIVTTFFKIGEYKYKSWKDNLRTIKLIKNQSIIKPNIKLNLNLDASAEEAKNKMKESILAEAKAHDNHNYCDEIYSIENIIEGERYYVNQKEKERIKKMRNNLNFYGGIVALIFGYISIWDCFTYYEEGENNIYFDKIVSDENIYKAGYMEEDQELEPFNYIVDPKLKPTARGYRMKFWKDLEKENELYNPSKKKQL